MAYSRPARSTELFRGSCVQVSEGGSLAVPICSGIEPLFRGKEHRQLWHFSVFKRLFREDVPVPACINYLYTQDYTLMDPYAALALRMALSLQRPILHGRLAVFQSYLWAMDDDFL